MQKYNFFQLSKKNRKKISSYLCRMENKLGKQLTFFVVFLAVIWVLLLALQVRLAYRLYLHQKDLFAVQLNAAFDDAFDTIEVVDYGAIDSLVQKSLSAHALLNGIKYDLGVFSENNQQLTLLTENADAQALLEKGFRYNLFRVNGDEASLDVILIHFPSLVRRFRLEIYMGYSVITILFILLLCCFINFFFILLKQRKINIFREKMAHFIVHELKTPLTTINLSAQLLKDDSVVTDEAAKDSYLNMITEETKTLESLVDEVLTVLRNENLPLTEMVDVEMHKLLEEVCKVHAPKLKECEAELAFDFKAEQDLVQGNYTHLFNAFSNLIDNAIKYREGKLELAISTRNLDNDIEIRVSDNGIGISKENLPLIFEPFSRFNTDNPHYVKGFGLGLNYVKHIVEYHKGTISVESELDKGTTFVLRLPLKNK